MATQNCWLLYAKHTHRGAKWLQKTELGRHVFWRHGSDSYTKQMRPGDTALVYLAGDDNSSGEIVGIAVVRSVRFPFIIDTQRTQRIPCLITRDLRKNPLPWSEIQLALSENLSPTQGQGAIHPVRQDVTNSIAELLQQSLPLSTEEAEQMTASSNLWQDILQYGDEFTLTQRYITRKKRESIELASLPRITSMQMLEQELAMAWQAHLEDAPPASLDTAVTQETMTTLETTEASQTKDTFSQEDEPDTPEPTPETTLEVFTAASMPDRVNSEAKDHLDVNTEAQAFARLVASVNTVPPLSIGIFGRWGSGKSFFMNRISHALNQLAESDSPGFHSDIVQVEFNAWHYMESNIWASLVDVIFRELDEHIRKAEGENTQLTLIEQLSTSQNLRIEAIENLASRLSHARFARESLLESQQKFAEHGPDGSIIWNAVVDKLKIQLPTYQSQLEEAGLQVNDLSGSQLRQLSDDMKQGVSHLSELKKFASRPWGLFLVATLLVGMPAVSVLAGSDIFHQLGTHLTWVAGVATTWLGTASAFAQKGVAKLNALRNQIDQARTAAIAGEQDAYDQARIAIEEADQSVKLAEQQVNAATEALLAESPGARISAFISDRANSDDYSKHLGVIASIRKDFEQLSELMHPKPSDAASQLETHRNAINTRIDRLKNDHKELFSKEDNASDSPMDAMQLQSAIQRLEQSLKTQYQGKDSKPPFTRIVLKIDDLDRCPSSKVAEVLQAVHLFLNFPLFVIMVCVDERWMSSSLIEEFGNLVDGENGATTSDYLEKIFQIPYWTRSMNDEDCRTFAKALVDEVNAGDQQTALKTDNDEKEEVASITTKQDDTPHNKAGQIFKNALKEIKGVVSEPTTGTEFVGIDENDPQPDLVAEQGDQGGDDLEDYETAAQQMITFNSTPLVLTEQEEKLIQEYAQLAGDTPRRTLRFLRVYMLLKSTLEDTNLLSSLQPDRKQKVDFKGQALLMQLAIATRIDSIAGVYFQALVSYRNMHIRHEWSRSGFSNHFVDICNKLNQDANTRLNSAEEVARDSIVITLNGMIDDELLKDPEFFEQLVIQDLFDTQHWAKRYTFSTKI